MLKAGTSSESVSGRVWRRVMSWCAKMNLDSDFSFYCMAKSRSPSAGVCSTYCATVNASGEMSYIKGRDTPHQASVESLSEIVVAGFDSRLEDKLSNTCQLHLARAL